MNAIALSNAVDTVITVEPVRRALDASEYCGFAGFLDMIEEHNNRASQDMVSEGAPDFDREVSEETEETQPEFIDPMSVHGSLPVKLAYVFENMELDTNRIYLASDASVEAANRANDRSGPRVPVIIRCATTGKELHTVYPSKGNEARKVTVVSGNRPAQRQTKTRQTGPSAEERELQQWLTDYNAAVKENNRRDAAWDAMIDAAERDNAKFDKQRDKAIRDEAARIAKAMEKRRNHPKTDTEAYQNWLLLTAEDGATCKELNHAYDVRHIGEDKAKANFGWRQTADQMEKQYSMVLIGKGRQCNVSEKRGLSEAMRLIERKPREDGLPGIYVPDGWILISKLPF